MTNTMNTRLAPLGMPEITRGETTESGFMVKLKYLVETTGHDGICHPDNKSEYTQIKRTCFVALPNNYIDIVIDGDIINGYHWGQTLHELDNDNDITLYDDWNCVNDPRSIIFGMAPHERRLTVLSATVKYISPYVKAVAVR